jgi:hypothetical protein
VRVCLGTACYVRGGKLVLEALKEELGVEVGGTTADGQFSLEVARCFGACGLAPTIMIDEDVHQRVKPLRLRVILDQYANGKGPAKAAAASKVARPAKKPSAKKAAGVPRGKAKRTVSHASARRPAAKRGGAAARPRGGAVARLRGAKR